MQLSALVRTCPTPGELRHTTALLLKTPGAWAAQPVTSPRSQTPRLGNGFAGVYGPDGRGQIEGTEQLNVRLLAWALATRALATWARSCHVVAPAAIVSRLHESNLIYCRSEFQLH